MSNLPDKGATPNSFDNNRDSLRVTSYLPIWFHPIKAHDIPHVKSDIADSAVSRRFKDQSDFNGDPDIKIIYDQLKRIERKISNLEDHLQYQKHLSYKVRPITINSSGCSIAGINKDEIPKEGEYIFLRFILTLQEKEEILVLGKMIRKEQSDAHWNVVIAFEDIALDHSDILARYLIQKQREDLRHKS